jgi:histidinol dehydrogenase
MQATGAMTYGTETIRPVDLVVGLAMRMSLKQNAYVRTHAGTKLWRM